MLLLLARFFCNFFIFQCQNNCVLLKYYDAKPKQMKLSVGSLRCSALNIPVVRSEDDDVMMSKEQLTLFSQLPKHWFLSPMTLKDPNSSRTVKPPPLLPA